MHRRTLAWVTIGLALSGCRGEPPTRPPAAPRLAEVVSISRAEAQPSATPPAAPEAAPLTLADGRLRASLPGTPRIAGDAREGQAIVLVGGVLQTVLWSEFDDAVSLALVRVVVRRVRAFVDGTPERVDVSPDRPALLIRTSQQPPRTHRTSLAFGVGHFVVIVEASAPSAFPDETAYALARSIVGTPPAADTTPIGGCAPSPTYQCIECVETDEHTCMFAREGCATVNGVWFPQGCPESLEDNIFHHAMTRREACVVAAGHEVRHLYLRADHPSETMPGAFAEDCAADHGRMVPSEPRAAASR